MLKLNEDGVKKATRAIRHIAVKEIRLMAISGLSNLEAAIIAQAAITAYLEEESNG